MDDAKTDKSDALATRLANYAGDVLLVVGEFPDTKEGRHVRDQLMRSGTAPGAHYAEARCAQSSADFIHKVSLAAKEARESLHWLRAGVRARYLNRDATGLIQEGDQLCAILTASLRTAQRNRNQR
jgi:four helix bundle protein